MTDSGKNAQMVAVILAGGQGRRMGGNKAAQNLAGQTLLAHVMARIAPQVDRVLVSVGPNSHRAATPAPCLNYTEIADAEAAHYLGPMAGIEAALFWGLAQKSPPDYLLSVAVDTPFLPDDLGARLRAAQPQNPQANPSIIRATCRGHLHPVIALWPLKIRSIDGGQNLADVIAEHRILTLKSGGKSPSIQQIQTKFPVGDADFPVRTYPDGTKCDPFFNINTPEDLAKAAQMMTMNILSTKY